MKKISWLGLLLLAILLVGCSQGEEQVEVNNEEPVSEEEVTDEVENGEQVSEEDQSADEIVDYAQTFINQLHEGKYEDATERFDETMAAQLTPEALEEIWETLQSQVGNFIDQEYKSIEEADGYRVVLLTGIFNNADVTFRVTFDDAKQIAGFFVQ